LKEREVGTGRERQRKLAEAVDMAMRDAKLQVKNRKRL